jgi:hypothetical protein
MDFLKWLRRASAENPASAASAEEENTTILPGRPARAVDLDAIEAIEAHMRWKARLESLLFGSRQAPLQADRIFRDNLSTLGRWLYGPGSERFGTLETFADLRRYNAEFHRHAGQAVLAFNAGRREEAIRMVTSGDYVRASSRIRQTLARLFAEAEERDARMNSNAQP